MQFDHLMHWVPSLDAAVADYQALGFTVQPGGHHPGSGTHNAAWRLDTRYIELIAVCDEAVAHADIGPGWPEIDATLRAGGGALAFGVLVDDVAATVAELRARGIPVEDPQAGSIKRSDGSPARGTLPRSRMGLGGRRSSSTTARRSIDGPLDSGSRDSRKIHGLCTA